MKLGKLPYGYDHKYTYSHIGYNLKVTDIQAAIGLAQLEKLPDFTKRRKANHAYLSEKLKIFDDFLLLPEKLDNSDPCWFGFMIIVKKDSPFGRLDLVNFLQKNKIETRSLFAGNLLRHPAYFKVKHKVIGNLKNSDLVMKNGFWIGVYPGNDKKKLEYVVSQFKEFCKKY